MEKDKTRRFVSINEAIDICNVSRRTVYNWIQRGSIKVYRLPSGIIRLDIKELIIERKNKNKE